MCREVTEDEQGGRFGVMDVDDEEKPRVGGRGVRVMMD